MMTDGQKRCLFDRGDQIKKSTRCWTNPNKVMTAHLNCLTLDLSNNVYYGSKFNTVYYHQILVHILQGILEILLRELPRPHLPHLQTKYVKHLIKVKVKSVLFERLNSSKFIIKMQKTSLSAINVLLIVITRLLLSQERIKNRQYMQREWHESEKLKSV